jgi:hypothetical protein
MTENSTQVYIPAILVREFTHLNILDASSTNCPML